MAVTAAAVRVDAAPDWPTWREWCARASEGSPGGTQAAGDETQWRSRLAAADLALVAGVDGRPAGLLEAALGYGGEAVVTSLWISDAAPHPREAADALMTALLAWAARQPSVDRVVVTGVEDDPRTDELCRRHGFDTVAGGTGPGVAAAGGRVLVRRLPYRVRVGVHSGQQYRDFASIRDLWTAAEALGFDWVSLFDHLRPPIFGPAGPCFDGPTLLSALAAATGRVRCALMVSPVVWRHPALTATIAATLDHVSGGRFELGVGVGGSDLAFEQYGIEQPPLSVRFRQLDEACHVLRLLLNGGPADYEGQHFRLAGAHLDPRPLQRRLPLVLGGSGERGTLPLVARHADAWNVALMPVERYSRAVDVLSELCAQAGRDVGNIRRSMTFRAVIRPDEVAAARARDRLSANADGHGPDLPEYLSFGSAQECLDRLAPYVELGVRDFLLGLRPPVDRETMEAFAEQVAPWLRKMVTA
ncbi:LLM class flavin-dependent oxidoreductase [Dactylosporangium sp. NPDC051541]|uniref:LLM class flavin-dependent oxidoreductase n=1 Tax=Dactylosporangium sp. NPDC051541 TaxID=3363977 RepID=UPI0037A2A3F3